MAKFTKKMQNNTIRLIALEQVSLDSYKVDGRLQAAASLLYVARYIDTIALFKITSRKQSITVKALSSNKILLTDVSISPDGAETRKTEIVLTLLGMGSYDFFNCL